MNRSTHWTTRLVAFSLIFAGLATSANATLIGTEQVAAAQGVVGASEQRTRVLALLERSDVAQALRERGVDPSQAEARVAALTDDEVARLAHTLDTAPAGASDVLGTIVFIFVLLLVTDILGLTKVFPFTRAIR